MSEFDKNSKANVIKFALLLSLVCGLLITAAASGLKGFQDDNKRLDKKKNLLKAAGFMNGAALSKEEINTLFETRIREVIVDSSGTITEQDGPNSLHLYFYLNEEGCVAGYILPINTRGLWGRIQGYLAFEKDGQTVSGFSVFSHSETPGLGGEIESKWFRDNFHGKKILNEKNQFVSVGIAKGKVEALPSDLRNHYVDGISGATLTGKYLSEGIRDTLMKYEGVSVTFRQNKGKPAMPKKDKG
ncbi:MAG: FMN-binding protein [Desulfobacterales bacterium]|nr:FMN-binding protein [Desulfobacterales bacterium]